MTTEATAGLTEFPSVTMPDYTRKEGESDADFMARVAQTSAEFQLQMMAFNGVHSASDKAIDTLDKVVDRQST